jgi:hypothetical protein
MLFYHERKWRKRKDTVLGGIDRFPKQPLDAGFLHEVFPSQSEIE